MDYVFPSPVELKGKNAWWPGLHPWHGARPIPLLLSFLPVKGAIGVRCNLSWWRPKAENFGGPISSYRSWLSGCGISLFWQGKQTEMVREIEKLGRGIIGVASTDSLGSHGTSPREDLDSFPLEVVHGERRRAATALLLALRLGVSTLGFIQVNTRIASLCL